MAWAVETFGWREVMASFGVASLTIGVALLIWVQDPQVDKPAGAGLSGYFKLLKMRVLWPIMIMTLLCYSPVAGIHGLWAGPY